MSNNALEQSKDARILLRGEVSEWKAKAAQSHKFNLDLAKDIRGLERALRHERKLREDVQNGSLHAKESIAQIRSLHHAWTEDEETHSLCQECGHFWPCPTIEAIRGPEQATITALKIMELELSKPAVRDVTPESDDVPESFT